MSCTLPLACAAVLLATSARSETAVSRPHPPPPSPPRTAPPRPITTTVTAEYEGSLFVKFLTVRSDFILGAADYRAGARARSTGAVDILHPFNVLAQSQGVFRDQTPLAAAATFVGGKRRTVDFRGKPAGFGSDPLTQLLRVGVAESSPCLGPLVFFDGKQRYLLTFSPLGPGALTAQQGVWGLSSPVRCRLGFQPISGIGGRGPPKGSPLRGPSTARFARSNTARFWILTGVDIGTILGEGHIELTSLRVSQTISAASPPPTR